MKGKYDIDVKLPSLRVYTAEIFTSEVESKSLLSLPHWGDFWGGGLFSETIRRIDKLMLPWFLFG